jgi:hypothetical protein
MVVVVIAVLAMWVADAATPNCDQSAAALVPCYSYVTGTDAKPPTGCCSGLSDLNTNSPACLCSLIMQLNSTASAQNPSLNITKAYNLPQDCSITLKTADCPALAGLPLSQGASGSAAGPSAAGPEAALTPGNDVGRVMASGSWAVMVVVAIAVVQALW